MSGLRRIFAAFGAGDNGRLGIGHLKGAVVPTIVGALLDEQAKSVSAGGAHTLFLTEDGTVYASGSNRYGQLGSGKEVQYTVEPQEVFVPEPVIAVAAGQTHSICISESGNVWTFGDNRAGQLGLGSAAASEHEPRMIRALEGARVRTAAAGSDHSVIATEGGEVFTWGGNRTGALGLGSNPSTSGATVARDEPSPMWVKGLKGVKVAQVTAGTAASAALCEDGKLYAWGQNTFGQLGLGKTPKNFDIEPSPTLVPKLPPLSSVSFGGVHAIGVSNFDQRAFVWGTDMRGSMGLGVEGLERRFPEPIAVPRLYLKQASAGWRHTVGVDSFGRLVSWGWGGAEAGDDGGGEGTQAHGPAGGQLGTGSQEDSCSPKVVKFVHPLGGQNAFYQEGKEWNPQLAAWHATHVSCGLNHTVAIIESKTAPTIAPHKP